MSVLVFDSGVGGLSILRELRLSLPSASLIYVADDAGFPYGDWEEQRLADRITSLFDRLIAEHRPRLCIIACNTASTIAIEPLRQRFGSTPFVGTVPAIKPAAERTSSGLISVLATPGTVDRAYTRNLVAQFASERHVTMVGAPDLALMAEAYMTGGSVDMDALKTQVLPCFVEREGKRTDIIVLGCTHYPFLANQMRKIAPWPVDWLNPAEAIAHRARAVAGELGTSDPSLAIDRAIFTSGSPDPKLAQLASSFGLTTSGRFSLS
ncbi:MAG: glutamate racemase [Pseudomonadota bacterium]